jgi:hypothetical protein
LVNRAIGGWGGRIRTFEMAAPKAAALPLGDAPERAGPLRTRLF